MKKINNSFGSSVGTKFSLGGRPLYFPGNTIISILERDSEIWRAVKAAQDAMFATPLKNAMVALPPYSFHMTTIEGVCNRVRDEEHWTNKLPIDATLDEVNSLFKELSKKFPPMPGITMRIDSLRVDCACAICLYPDTYADDKAMRDWRDEMSDIIGVKFPGHDRYGFHIGLGYGLRPLDEVEEDALASFKEKFDASVKEKTIRFTPPQPELVFFDSMFSFGEDRA